MTEENATIVEAHQRTAEIASALADLIREAGHPRLGAAVVLNAAMFAAIEVLGEDGLRKSLEQAIKRLPTSAAILRSGLQ